MAYLTRDDIPYHYALADAFTVCDAYYCSLLGPTDPNRYHMWTGWVGNDGKGGGPVVDNAEAGYDWSSYPERLEKAGISWKIYQDVGAGLDAAHYWGWGDDAYIGNYGDNSLLYLHQYQNAAPGTPLHERAVTGTDISKGGTLFDDFRADVAAGRLPQVSWIVAPEAYTEHPNWPANYGAWYIAQILDAITSNPEVWSKTALFIMYDENDGFFDHLVPPTPPATRDEGLSSIDTTNEIFPGSAKYASGPYGLGVRVPMIVVSPWSKGGWVDSEVFDHTSLIRFLERRFAGRNEGLIETNITPWRRAITGDLTSAFDFASHHHGVPHLPPTGSYVPPDAVRHPDYKPVPPAAGSLPKQEPGLRPARPLPYELHAGLDARAGDKSVELRFHNSGRAAAVLHVRSGDAASTRSGPWTYTVGPRDTLADLWKLDGDAPRYDLSVHGPNGFLRAFQGTLGGEHADLAVKAFYDAEGGIALEVINRASLTAHVKIADGYGGRTVRERLEPGRSFVWRWSLEGSHGWYDLAIEVEGDASFSHRLAGHVETGRPSASDPAFGR
jgi:phospholipase C